MQTNERSWFYVQISTLMSHYDSSFKFQYEARKMFDRHFIDPTGEMTVLQQCDKE